MPAANQLNVEPFRYYQSTPYSINNYSDFPHLLARQRSAGNLSIFSNGGLVQCKIANQIPETRGQRSSYKKHSQSAVAISQAFVSYMPRIVSHHFIYYNLSTYPPLVAFFLLLTPILFQFPLARIIHKPSLRVPIRLFFPPPTTARVDPSKVQINHSLINPISFEIKNAINGYSQINLRSCINHRAADDSRWK